MVDFSTAKFVQIDAGSVLGPLSVAYRGAPGGIKGHTAIGLHELGGSGWSWGPLAGALSTEWSIVAPDLPGAGLSEKPVSEYSLRDLACAVSRFKQTLGLTEPVVFFGQAMGSVLALEMALQFPADVAGLVLVDGTSSMSEQARNYLMQRSDLVAQNGMRAVVDTSFNNAFRNFVPANGAVRQRLQEYRARFASNSPDAYGRSSRALANHVSDQDAIRTIGIPVLVVTGEHDFIWPPAVGQALCNLVRDGQYRVVRGAAHFSAFQTPAEVASLIEPFWRKLLV